MTLNLYGYLHNPCLPGTSEARNGGDARQWHHSAISEPMECSNCNGSLRLCVDFRRLNSVSKADAYPMPRVDELIDRLGKAKYLSVIDLTRGYWQIPLVKTAQEKTAFSTPFGLFQFTVMPFGLRGAPATFQRLMDQLIRGQCSGVH